MDEQGSGGARRLRLFGAVSLVCCTLALAAQSEVPTSLFHAEFSAESWPVSGPGDPWPVPPELRSKRILEEAAWVYSGIVWGFEFGYTPYDKLRGIAEHFELSSLGSIGQDDPQLSLGVQSIGENETRAFVDYRPLKDEEARVTSYAFEPWHASQGIGKAEYMLGWKGRRAAYEDALREAVRAYLRLIEPNKPRLVKGRVVFERVPVLSFSGGFYTCAVKARVEVSEVRSYELY